MTDQAHVAVPEFNNAGVVVCSQVTLSALVNVCPAFQRFCFGHSKFEPGNKERNP